MMRDEVSKKLKDARKNKGWTQRDLEAKSGVSQPHISRAERSKGSITLDVFFAITGALGVKVTIE